jgi:hypothetical protein
LGLDPAFSVVVLHGNMEPGHKALHCFVRQADGSVNAANEELVRRESFE